MRGFATEASKRALWGFLVHHVQRLVTRIAREEDKFGFFTSQFHPSSCSTAYWLDRKHGKMFVDIGAHIGHLRLLAATRVGPTGRVVATRPRVPTWFG
jgi:hypothetical protein